MLKIKELSTELDNINQKCCEIENEGFRVMDEILCNLKMVLLDFSDIEKELKNGYAKIGLEILEKIETVISKHENNEKISPVEIQQLVGTLTFSLAHPIKEVLEEIK